MGMADVNSAIANAQFPLKLQCLFSPEYSRYRVLWGGRGSGKSWGAARALLIKGVQKPVRVLCAREFMSSMRDSVHKLLCDQIIDLGLTDFYEITQSSIRAKNGTEFSFIGLKNNVANVKSYEGVDVCWVEEAQTVSRLSWDVLIPTIRKEGSEIWITFNPLLETDDTWQRFVVHRQPEWIVQKVNWQDNPWFNDTLRAEDKAFWLTVRDLVKFTLNETTFEKIVATMRESTEKTIQAPDKAIELVTKKYSMSESESGGVLQHLIKGGDLTSWGLGNAVTRMAQDVNSYDRSTELEAIGFEIMQNNWN